MHLIFVAHGQARLDENQQSFEEVCYDSLLHRWLRKTRERRPEQLDTALP
jgi:hypothetical protein